MNEQTFILQFTLCQACSEVNTIILLIRPNSQHLGLKEDSPSCSPRQKMEKC